MAIIRRRNKHEPACRRERASHVHCSRCLYALRFQFFNNTERHSPDVLACIDIESHHLPPRWLLARPVVLGIPESLETVANPGSGIVSSWLGELSHIGQVEHVIKQISERRIVRTAV